MCPPDFRCAVVVANSLVWSVEMEIPDALRFEATAQSAKPTPAPVHNTTAILVAAPVLACDWARKYLLIFLLAPFYV
jgi:hypothetical protein